MQLYIIISLNRKKRPKKSQIKKYEIKYELLYIKTHSKEVLAMYIQTHMEETIGSKKRDDTFIRFKEKE